MVYAPIDYQLDFTTPGILPSRAKFPEVNTAQPKATDIAARTTTHLARIRVNVLAAIAHAHFVLALVSRVLPLTSSP